MSFTLNDPVALRRIEWTLASQRVQVKFLRLDLMLKAGFDPSQPRVPAGNPDGGEWTDAGGSRWQLAQNTPRRPGSGSRPRSGLGQATPAQQTQLDLLRSQAETAIRRVQERDRTWKPTPSFYETIDGEIGASRAIIQEANARLAELERIGIGQGYYTGQSIPARSESRSLRVEERNELNRIGRTTGCHTCGSTDPGTHRGNFVGDHQLPNAMNPPGREQRLYPQCLTCSRAQGNWISRNKGGPK